MVTYEKQPPKRKVSDEQKTRRILYYYSDIEPYPLHASVELRATDGSSSQVDVELSSKALSKSERDSLEAIGEKVWKAALFQDKFVEKP